jgi:NAD(P) transhydrogenase subunit beta
MTSLGWAIEAAYLAASVLFIFGLRYLSSPETARKGMFLAEVGMGLAIVGTLFHYKIITFEWILAGLVVGSIAGYIIAMYTPMTAMPQRTAFSHAFGALAAALVGVSEHYTHGGHLDRVTIAALGFEVVLGALTFTGSMMAFAKLQEWMRGSPITYRGQNAANMGLLAAIIALLVYLVVEPQSPHATAIFYTIIGLSLVFGVLLVLPIGAADMPVVISLLNSYAGLAACATGFVLGNKLLIIAGALDGASGVVLSVIMCKAMNRSMTNVLFGAFGQAPVAGAGAAAPASGGEVKKISASDTAALALRSKLVIVVPGYGMAAAQAQHGVREFADVLKSRGVRVRYAIHPVAGRMPGHMNVLLAEARVPYDELIDMDEINPEFEHADVALVMGANDVTNPAARHNPASPIYGMPILNTDHARHVIVCKRSMNPGFAGIDNELYTMPHTSMLFGDAKKTAEALATAAKDLLAGDAAAAAATTTPSLPARDASGPSAGAVLGYGDVGTPAPAEDPFYAGKVRRSAPRDVASLLSDAKHVVIVPGYGMARAQAQLAVRDLARALAARGTDVRFALHPFAGCFPGHINYLLADADVPYEQVHAVEASDGAITNIDVALVVGANDVVNPDRVGPLDGMPPLDLRTAKHVVVLKRGYGQGHSGVPNALLTRPNTVACFGDAKQSIEAIVGALRG